MNLFKFWKIVTAILEELSKKSVINKTDNVSVNQDTEDLDAINASQVTGVTQTVSRAVAVILAARLASVRRMENVPAYPTFPAVLVTNAVLAITNIQNALVSPDILLYP